MLRCVCLQDTVQTMWAVGGMCLCFLALSALQAYVLNNSAQGSARHAWYEEHKAQVVALPQQAVARLAAHKDSQSAPELRALVISMVRCAKSGGAGGIHLGGAHSLKGAAHIAGDAPADTYAGTPLARCLQHVWRLVVVGRSVQQLPVHAQQASSHPIMLCS
jgi:hypothetical protein